MTVQELKTKIENGYTDKGLLILKCTDNNFVATQYYKAIAKSLHMPIEYISEPSEISLATNDIFGCSMANGLQVLIVDELDYPYEGLHKAQGCVIICSSVEKGTNALYSEYVVTIPKLEPWQVKDYIYSIAQGVESKQLDWLLDICKNDIYRLQSEIDKLLLFNKGERKSAFNALMKDGAVGDLAQNTIFNLTNAIIKKDKNTIVSVCKELHNIDSNGMGFLSILYSSFKNVINIQLGHNPTAESCGLKPNQFWAIKKNNIGFYTKDELLNIFNTISDIDKKVKTGDMPVDMIIDYLVVKILGV